MSKLKITYRDPASLIPYENNPRENDNAVPYLMNSIQEYGFLNPVIVDRDDVVVAGHTRIKAAMELGLKEVPVVRAEDLTKEQADAFRLVDNRVGEIAWWDRDKLAEEMRKLDIEWENFGFDPMPDMDDMPVWSGEDEVSDDSSSREPVKIVQEVSDECRLLVTVPSAAVADEVRAYLESMDCKVKQLE